MLAEVNSSPNSNSTRSSPTEAMTHDGQHRLYPVNHWPVCARSTRAR